MTSPASYCVLVVEDDEDIQSVYRAILEDEGYRVKVAGNGEVAIQALKDPDHGVSLILLDVMMPTLGGLGFLKHKAADPGCAELPVVILSAIPDLTPIPASADIKAVLTKPVSLTELLAVVRGWAAPPVARPAADASPPA